VKDIFELTAGDTTTTETQGSSFTAYALSPVNWLKEIVDAAKKKHYAAQLVQQHDLPQGTKDLVIPVRTKYLGSGDWATSQSTQGSAVNFTKLDNLDGVTITPTDQNYAVSLSNRAIRTNVLNIVQQAKEELINWAGDVVDIAVFTALKDSSNQATSSAKGAQWLYGGEARLDSELAAGDTITTDMIADAKRMLMSTICKYWNVSSAGSIQTSSASKNPWMPEAADPFFLLVAPEQAGVLEKDSQFVNAAEYGGREIVEGGLKVGEIGAIGNPYLGVRIIVSPNVPYYSTSDDSPDGESSANPGAAMHRCIMLKGKKAGALGWGQRPRLKVSQYDRELSTDIILEMAYQAKAVHTDAMVYLDVTDE